MAHSGMRTTIDQSGHVVIPKALRDQLGLRPGEVEVGDETVQTLRGL